MTDSRATKVTRIKPQVTRIKPQVTRIKPQVTAPKVSQEYSAPRAIRVVRSGEPAFELPIYPDAEYSFGRDRSCTVVIADDSVSRDHGLLSCRTDGSQIPTAGIRISAAVPFRPPPARRCHGAGSSASVRPIRR